MSRSGRIAIKVPENTEVKVENGIFFAKGKLGELSYQFNNQANVELVDNNIVVKPAGETKQLNQMWGTVRSRIFNVVVGVSNGFSKELELNGVGYKANQKGNILELFLGFSHTINFSIPSDIKIEVPKPTAIKVSGIDKQRVGQVAANIREFRKPEPFKGKGVKYKDEYIRRKEGKKKWSIRKKILLEGQTEQDLDSKNLKI